MKTAEFTDILQHPQQISEQQIDAIKSVIDEFPYFQSAHAIYLKALKDKSSFKYNQALKTTAAYTTDRSVLFDFITSEEFIQNKISQRIKQNFENLKDIELYDIEDISINKSVVIDDALKQHIKDAEPVLDPHLFESKIQAFEETFKIDIQDVEETPQEKLNIGKPLEFDKTETHSFSEWLKITSFKPIIREETETNKIKSQNDTKSKKLDLIDKFIAANPKIQPIKETSSPKDISQRVAHQSDSLMTETLARIYLEQKNYEKAIQAYRILSLKYPEKSGFFADQIKAVKELQENNT